VLVPTILVNQGLLLAHAHLDQEVERSDSHAARPHFHLGTHTHEGVSPNSGHSHAGHSDSHHSDSGHSDSGHARGDHAHEKQLGNTGHGSDEFEAATAAHANLPIGEHESDAIYCSASRSFVREADTVEDTPEADFTGPNIVRFADHLEALRHIAQDGVQPLAMLADSCPLYLRILSLRI